MFVITDEHLQAVRVKVNKMTIQDLKIMFTTFVLNLYYAIVSS